MSKKKRKVKINLARLVLLIVLLLVIISGITAFALVATSVATMPAFNPDDISFAASAEIYDDEDQLITRIGAQNRIPVEIEDVPDVVINAFIAIEDNRFRKHIGIDPYRILGAAWKDIKTGSLKEGASTITQQLVRHSTDIGNDKKFQRKIQEAILAIQMERHFSKNEILELYLNGIYLGEGYGVQVAAQAYFNKNIQDVSLEEAALIAGLPQAPSTYNPITNIEAAKNRRNIVLDQMARFGYITQTEADAAKEKDVILNPIQVSSTDYPYSYFIDYMITRLTDEHNQYQLSEADVFKGGLRIYTSLSQKMQQAAEGAVANDQHFPPAYKNSNDELIEPLGAAVVYDPYTGYVKALVGGRNTQGKMLWNYATTEKRRPGSTFKPIAAYGPAIEYLGRGPATIYDDIPFSRGNYAPRNSDGTYRGLVPMRYALAHSINIPAVKAMDETGIDKTITFSKALGIDELLPTDGLPTALGGMTNGITPLQLAAAYGAFVNNGIYVEPTVIRKIEKLDGTVLFENIPQQRRAMKETTAFLITDILKDVIAQGTGTRARLDRPAAGKTGTADNKNNQASDIWFAGYTPDLVGITWIGNKNQNHRLSPGSFGGNYTATMWKDMMQKAHQGLPKRNFPSPPAGIIRATVDSKSGLLPGPNTPSDHLITDYFLQGTVPKEKDSSHTMLEVCAVSGQLPSEFCTERISKVFIKLPYTTSNAADIDIRIPTTVCTIHTLHESGEDWDWLPDAPNEVDQDAGGWLPQVNIPQ